MIVNITVEEADMLGLVRMIVPYVKTRSVKKAFDDQYLDFKAGRLNSKVAIELKSMERVYAFGLAAMGARSIGSDVEPAVYAMDSLLDKIEDQ